LKCNSLQFIVWSALIWGITATILWEITRRVLVWYYAVISMVNLIYGSFATVVVALLSIEAVALTCLPQFGPNFDARERLITDCPRIIA